MFDFKEIKQLSKLALHVSEPLLILSISSKYASKLLMILPSA
jgi:hypothetical protein